MEKLIEYLQDAQKFIAGLRPKEEDENWLNASIIIDEAIKEAKIISPNAMLTADAKGYKEKYEKCIEVIKRFDAGIIGMYDL